MWPRVRVSWVGLLLAYSWLPQHCASAWPGQRTGLNWPPLQGDGEVKRREDLRRRQTNPSTTLFVVNFDPDRTRERDLERHFEPYGRLVRVQIKRNYAFVQYENIDQATDALKGTHLSRLDGAPRTLECVMY